MPRSSNERTRRRASILIIALLTAAAAVLPSASAQEYGWGPLGSGMNSDVYALTVYNGELIAGGNFTTAGGVACNRIARWNGSQWQPLGTGMSGTSSPFIRTLTVFNGELIAGGSFTTAGGVTCNYIARWAAVGACCFVNGACQVLSPTTCDAAGGAYQGNGTGCHPNRCPALPGDIDGDGDRDMTDVGVFIDVLLDLDTDPHHVAASDINQSGTADGLDIQPFVDLLLTP